MRTIPFYFIGGRIRPVGGAFDQQRGKAARYREKYDIRPRNRYYDELSGVVHDDNDRDANNSDKPLWEDPSLTVADAWYDLNRKHSDGRTGWEQIDRRYRIRNSTYQYHTPWR